MIPKFRKKPVVIEAMLFDGSRHTAVPILAWIMACTGQNAASWDASSGTMTIRTLEGDLLARQGDFIIRGVAGEFSPCKPDIFAATYDPEP